MLKFFLSIAFYAVLASGIYQYATTGSVSLEETKSQIFNVAKDIKNYGVDIEHWINKAQAGIS